MVFIFIFYFFSINFLPLFWQNIPPCLSRHTGPRQWRWHLQRTRHTNTGEIEDPCIGMYSFTSGKSSKSNGPTRENKAMTIKFQNNIC